MKKLSIEQKAKRYDEAIKVARSKIKNDKDHVLYEEDITDIFHELKESEDEKIRKELISFVRRQIECHDKPNVERDEKFESWIAWLEKQNSNVDNANKEYWRGYREGKQEILDKYADLEKQGEQNPADNIPQDFEKYVEHLLSLSDGEGHGSPAKVKEVSAELFKLAKLEHKPAWSEEDEDYINDLIKYFSQNEGLKNTKEDIVIWLKSLNE